MESLNFKKGHGRPMYYDIITSQGSKLPHVLTISTEIPFGNYRDYIGYDHNRSQQCPID